MYELYQFEKNIEVKVRESKLIRISSIPVLI